MEGPEASDCHAGLQWFDSSAGGAAAGWQGWQQQAADLGGSNCSRSCAAAERFADSTCMMQICCGVSISGQVLDVQWIFPFAIV